MMDGTPSVKRRTWSDSVNKFVFIVLLRCAVLCCSSPLFLLRYWPDRTRNVRVELSRESKRVRRER
jgi:hypothetical protein